jgi:competence protein ComEA
MQSPNVAITPPHKESTRQQVNLNTATAAELTALPGIGVTMAQRIVAFREQHGKFQRLEDLAKVRGIGRRKIEVLRDRVIVP